MKYARNAIIRPRRKKYDITAIPFTLEYAENTFCRIPITYVNKRLQKIFGSLYFIDGRPPEPGDSCIIYLHGNASSQLEGRFLVPNFCPHNVSVFCFDFAGCGLSEGDFISLGYFESMDTDFVINQLTQQFGFSKFALWGRSMGAATAVITKTNSIVAKVVDSSFTSIKDMVSAVAGSFDVPSMLRPFVCWCIRNSVDSVANFDFDLVSPIDEIKTETKPIIIGHSIEDKIIPFQQGLNLCEACSSEKKMFMQLPGGHNSKRPLEWTKQCVMLVLEGFGIPCDDNIKVHECHCLRQHDAHFSTRADFFEDEPNNQKKNEEKSEECDDGERRKHRRHSSGSE